VKIAHHFTAPFDNLTIAAQESGTYRGRRQSRQAWGALTALLFDRPPRR